MQAQLQVTENEEWSKLSTVSNFDTGSTYPIDGSRNDDGAIQQVKHFSPTSLLVESLIEQLCKLFDSDPINQKNLYQVICQRLHQMKLIEETYNIEEFGFVRSHYQKSLFQLLDVAKSTILNGNQAKNVILPFSRGDLDLAAPFVHQEHLLNLHWSRYDSDYEELEYIAKGGFGQVFKARNKLDGGEYAVKKIVLRYRNVSSFLQNLREVKLLAKLSHPSIVSYKAAWLEPLELLSPREQIRRNKEKGPSTVFHLDSVKKILNPVESEDDSSGIVFKDSQSSVKPKDSHSEEIGSIFNVTSNSVRNDSFYNLPERTYFDEKSFKIFDNSVGNCVQNQGCAASESTSVRDVQTSNQDSSASCGSSSNSFQEKAVCRFRWRKEESHLDYNGNQHEWATLYIQMELCKCTLRQWLDERNGHMPQTVMCMKQSMDIFQQVVSGVAYIHSQGIVHHDIKPSNIFLNGDINHVQVGDFGLACFLQHSTEDLTLIRQKTCQIDHKGEIGTKLYAAPEQLNGKCDPKSDIYSLGIVLFELIQPFRTDMEKSKLISLLKNNELPAELSIKYPQLVQLLERLLSPVPEARPTAQELLVALDSVLHVVEEETSQADNYIDSKETVEKLLAIISQKDREIEELKHKLQEMNSCK